MTGLDPRFEAPGVLDSLAGMVANHRAGRVQSRLIDPDAVIPGDLVLMVRPDGRTELIFVDAVMPLNIGGRPHGGGYYVEYQKAGREWELVYRAWPPSLSPYRPKQWQLAALEADGYFS